MWALIEEIESISYLWNFSSSLLNTEEDNFVFLLQIVEKTWIENPSIYRYSWSSCEEEPQNIIQSLFLRRKEGTVFRLYVQVVEQ